MHARSEDRMSSLMYTMVKLVYGTLYPAYYSFKAVKERNVQEYVHWMTYWIVLASLTIVESVVDIVLGFWLPLYYSLKIGFLVWLLSPLTEGSSLLYKEVLHPILFQKEKKIDRFSQDVWETVYHTLGSCFREGLGKMGTVVAQSIYNSNQSDSKTSYINDTVMSYEDIRAGKEKGGNVKRREIKGRSNLGSRRKTSSLYETVPSQEQEPWDRTQSLYENIPKKNPGTISLSRLGRGKQEMRETEKSQVQEKPRRAN